MLFICSAKESLDVTNAIYKDSLPGIIHDEETAKDLCQPYSNWEHGRVNNNLLDVIYF